MTLTPGLYLAGLFLLLALTPAAASAQSQAGPAYVTRVVDGITLYADIAGHIEVVRYRGVRVPRIDDPNYGNSPYAASAREANRRLVEGQWIWLLFDREPRDAQGRLRAWVWRDGRDALFVNGALVHGGWAVGAATDPQLAEYFATFEASARQGSRGLWRSPRSIAYYQPQPVTLGDNDTDSSDAGDTRIFSAPAPFPPPQSYSPGRTSAPSAAGAPIPSVSSSSSSMTGGAGYSTPSRSSGSRTVK